MFIALWVFSGLKNLISHVGAMTMTVWHGPTENQNERQVSSLSSSNKSSVASIAQLLTSRSRWTWRKSSSCLSASSFVALTSELRSVLTTSPWKGTGGERLGRWVVECLPPNYSNHGFGSCSGVGPVEERTFGRICRRRSSPQTAYRYGNTSRSGRCRAS